jgi:hypothetical protein
MMDDDEEEALPGFRGVIHSFIHALKFRNSSVQGTCTVNVFSGNMIIKLSCDALNQLPVVPPPTPDSL